MKPQIASSIEQSRRLLSCGVDPKTADMNHRYGSYPTPIIQFDLNGNIIARFSGIREAERYTGYTHGVICKCCKNKTPQVGNYIFLYEHDVNSINARVLSIKDYSHAEISNEEWRPVVNFEGLYEVSNYGRVKSLERVTKVAKGFKIIPTRLLTQKSCSKQGKPRLYVELYSNGNSKKYIVARLVAMSFIPNPDNLPQVNHKDENPINNKVDNLEWCTASYNLSYNNLQHRNAKKRINSGMYAVVQLDDNGNLIKEYPSAIEAARQLGCAKGSISRCIRGNRNHAAGYKWMKKSEWLCANGYSLNKIEE